MFVIRHRSIAVSMTTLFTVLSSTVAAQGQPTSALSNRQAAIQSNVTADDNDDAELVLAEPDFRVLNLPSTLRLPVRGSNFQLTHRFNGNLRQGTLEENASNLFGLDQGAVVGFEYRFGVARHLQAAVYRTGLDKTFQFYGKYDAVRQGDSIPVSLSALVSVEGADNFQERYSPALGAVVSRMVADRLALYATPVWVHDTAASLNIDRDTFFVGIGGRLRVSATVYLVGEVALVLTVSATALGVLARQAKGGVEEVKTVDVVASRFKFEPAIISVVEGNRVRLRLRSVDRTHGIGIKAFRVKALIPMSAEAVTVEFVADRTGTFDITCSEYCGTGHRAMKGRLIVQAKQK